MTALLNAPVWLVVVLLALLVLVLYGPERAHVRLLELLRAVRGAPPPGPPATNPGSPPGPGTPPSDESRAA